MRDALVALGLVGVNPAWRRALPWLPRVVRPGRVIIGPTGQRLRAREDGSFEDLRPGGLPRAGAASDPANARG